MKTIKLIAQAKSGDVTAFEELLQQYSDQLYRTAFLYVGNREDALDIVQETSFKAYIAIKTLRKNKYFSTWLTRILINSANEFLNKNKKDIPFDNVEQLVTEKVEMNVEQMDLVRAINTLKKNYRDVVILYYFRDFQIKDIARIMSIPENTVKTYLLRGRDQLRTNLKGGDYDGRKKLS